MRITVSNLKGGVAKTTSAVMLSLGLSERGRTLLVDADPKQSSALSWAGLAEDWPDSCSVVAITGQGLAKRLASMSDDYAHVVVDCGAKSEVETRQALMVTEQLIVPASPSVLDIVELPATFAVAAEIDAIHPIYASVLLTKVRSGTRSSVNVRAALAERDIPVFRSQIGLREAYGDAYGTVPLELLEYRGLLDELFAEDAE